MQQISFEGKLFLAGVLCREVFSNPLHSCSSKKHAQRSGAIGGHGQDSWSRCTYGPRGTYLPSSQIVKSTHISIYMFQCVPPIVGKWMYRSGGMLFPAMNTPPTPLNLQLRSFKSLKGDVVHANPMLHNEWNTIQDYTWECLVGIRMNETISFRTSFVNFMNLAHEYPVSWLKHQGGGPHIAKL